MHFSNQLASFFLTNRRVYPYMFKFHNKYSFRSSITLYSSVQVKNFSPSDVLNTHVSSRLCQHISFHFSVILLFYWLANSSYFHPRRQRPMTLCFVSYTLFRWNPNDSARLWPDELLHSVINVVDGVALHDACVREIVKDIKTIISGEFIDQTTASCEMWCDLCDRISECASHLWNIRWILALI